MLKKILKFIILILMIIGIFLGLSITFRRMNPGKAKKNAEINILNKIQTKPADIVEFYTYGRSFNLKGKIQNVSKDNFESVKLVIADGMDYEREYVLNYEFDENNLVFTSSKEINAGIILDNLSNEDYYILIRLKLNNNIDPKYYSFANTSGNENIEYYTITKDNLNRKANIDFVKINHNNNDYNLLKISIEDSELPENVYDIVIDAGHGGKDKGENAGSITESDTMLLYAENLKTKLEQAGYKVKLTRDSNNTDSYTYSNMYDSNGRISIACESKAKLMLSLHINQGTSSLSGLEVYCPPNSKLDFANSMAKNIVDKTSIGYSNNTAYKVQDGVYVWNFTKNVIKEFENTASKKGYEPYNITLDTPYLYTIREVGGIATNAYVDGRNKDYSANRYYKSNQGIECYQIQFGYIKTDVNIITSEMEQYLDAIVQSVVENY